MTINEKTNLYEEASNFCKMHGLEPYIAVILENEIFQEVLKVKEEMMNKELKNSKSVGKMHKNKNTKSQEKLYID